MKIKLSKKQKAAIKSYLRGVVVSAFAFVTSDQLGLPWEVSALIAAVLGPLIRGWDKTDDAFGRVEDEVDKLAKANLKK